MTVCLDSWAVLAWLDGEQPALERVEALLPDRPWMSWLNLVEVHYRIQRDHGAREAETTVSELRGLLTLDLPGTARMLEAARLKAVHAIALADCFAVATAAARDVPLHTGDPEILRLDSDVCATEDLRPA